MSQVLIKGSPDPIDNLDQSWSTTYKWTLEIRNRYNNIWSVPRAESLVAILKRHVKDGSLLDVGASEMKEQRENIKRLSANIEYKSFDIDRKTQQDYYDWAEVDREFDYVLSAEVVEHIPYEQDLALFRDIYRKLKPGGIFIVTTPNIHHPTRIWTDPTHISWWCYDRLAGTLLANGFDLVGLYRFAGRGMPKPLKARLVWSVMEKVRRHMEIDNMKSVCAVMQKPAAK
jgi:SAM-dependent methyltransferase